MKTIELTDRAARISNITETNGVWTVNLEWGGSSDRTINDFNLSPLGAVTGSGGNLCGGWAVLYGEPLLQVGDTIPLLPLETGHTNAAARDAALADAPKGIRELRKIPFATLKEWIDRYRKANPGYYVAIRSRADAHICLTDSWGQVLPHYMPYFRA